MLFFKCVFSAEQLQPTLEEERKIFFEVYSELNFYQRNLQEFEFACGIKYYHRIAEDNAKMERLLEGLTTNEQFFVGIYIDGLEEIRERVEETNRWNIYFVEKCKNFQGKKIFGKIIRREGDYFFGHTSYMLISEIRPIYFVLINNYQFEYIEVKIDKLLKGFAE